jgi:hypothetical protein
MQLHHQLQQPACQVMYACFGFIDMVFVHDMYDMRGHAWICMDDG